MQPLQASFCRLPRGAGVHIERSSLTRWLAQSAGAPVRLLYGPIGSGKSVALQQHVERSGGTAGYLRVPPGAGAGELLDAIGAGAFAEIVLDDLDRAGPAALDALVTAIRDGRVDTRLTLAGRSRYALRAHELVPRGLAASCDPTALRFDHAAIAELAGQLGVPYDAQDIAQLEHDSDGWALAVEWLVRDAAAAGRPLHDAFLHWRERNGHVLLEFLEHDGYGEPGAGAAFRRLLRGNWERDQDELARLEQAGFPILRDRRGLRPYRIIAQLAGEDAPSEPRRSTAAHAHIMMVTLFGRFGCSVGGREVVFARRRDQHVFAYVALAPEARASREELIDTFWPDSNRTLGAQGLRTTLSRIRRSIAAIAPGIDPGRYFLTSGEVRVDRRTVSVDATRFDDHVEEARVEEQRDAREAARFHYRIAHRMYADRLLGAEAPDPVLTRLADRYDARYAEVLTRLVQLHAADGDGDASRGYLRELLSRNADEARRRALCELAAPAMATA